MRLYMFNSILNKIIVILSVFLILIGLFIGNIFVPVFAIDSFSPISYTDSFSSSHTITYNYDIYFDYGYNDIKVYPVSDYDNTYIFCVQSPVGSNFSNIIYFVSTEPISVNSILSNADSFQSNQPSASSLNSTYNLYVASRSFYTGPNYGGEKEIHGFSYYETFDLGMSAVFDFIDSVNNPVYTPLYDNFNIPRGYLAYIEFNFLPSTLNVSTTFPNYSDFWNNKYIFNTQWYEGYHSQVITIPDVLSNGGDDIPWTKGSDRNIWGQSKNASASISVTGSVDAPFFICNPVYQAGSNSFSSLFNNELPMNGSITISDPDGAIKKIRLYSLQSQYNSESDSIDTSLSYDTPSYIVDVDTNGAISYQPINSSSPAVSSPLENGGTYVDPTEYSTSDIISTIQSAFDNLVKRIESIFHPAAGYFNTLVNSFNDFVHWLTNLWAWLPSPIVNLIEAVLYVSICVGLIKLILK